MVERSIQGLLVFLLHFVRLPRRHGLLNPNDSIDIIYCLHRVYFDHINQSITAFVRSWVMPKLKSEGNKTPLDLFFNSSREESADPDLDPSLV